MNDFIVLTRIDEQIRVEGQRTHNTPLLSTHVQKDYSKLLVRIKHIKSVRGGSSLSLEEGSLISFYIEEGKKEQVTVRESVEQIAEKIDNFYGERSRAVHLLSDDPIERALAKK